MTTTGIILILLVSSLVIPLEYSHADTTPLSPTNLKAQAISSSQLSLTWNAPVNATQSNVNGYKIETDVGCIGFFTVLVANTTATSYSNNNLVSGLCYGYRVFALNSAGTSSSSNVSSATTFSIPSAPTGLIVTPVSSSALKLSWNVPADNGGTQITGYQIQRNGTVIVTNTGNNRTSFTDNNLLALHQQTYRIAAWNIVGLSIFSNNATAKTENQTGNGSPTDTGNLGHAISDFVHKRNELLKKQRDEVLKVMKDCTEKMRNTNSTQRKQIQEDCKIQLNAIKEKYKDSIKQFKNEFKNFRETAKSTLNEAKKDKAADKNDIKEFKKDVKSFEKDGKKQEKEFKKELKSANKNLKKENKNQKGKNHDNED
ncbi:MAG: fibronectin type III domain-containing protein [Candidatus Nitrosotenuis sp.]|nr:MAG: fibronectin type III domain-containing protein [Candidatus Nitrosotenuis sp.]